MWDAFKKIYEKNLLTYKFCLVIWFIAAACEFGDYPVLDLFIEYHQHYIQYVEK